MFWKLKKCRQQQQQGIMAEQEHKFMFIYLHSPQYPSAPTFCMETLCSELARQFLDVNLVFWRALAIEERVCRWLHRSLPLLERAMQSCKRRHWTKKVWFSEETALSVKKKIRADRD